MAAMAKAIPLDVAVALCQTIRAENRIQRWTFKALWCRRCELILGGRPYFANRADNRGCAQLNARFDDEAR